MTSQSIGDWTFDPAINELRRGEERRRLEHRTARTLELLHSRAGDVVSADEIRAHVWNGRTISSNSVPVVISNLRQALSDDAHSPRYIETVAKRGYRLIVSSPEGLPRQPRSVWRIVTLAAVVLALAGAFTWAISARGPALPALVVSPVQNATGSAAYQPLVNASSALLMAEAEQLSGVQVYLASRPGRDEIKLESWLFIWNGRPTLMMSARREGGPVLWTGVTAGGEQQIPADIAREMRLFGERLKRQSPK